MLDASAMLAWILDEPGGDAVAAEIPGAVIAAVNVAEVAERLHRDFDGDAVRASLALMLPPAIAADLELSVAAGLLTTKTRAAGLSLGDRFCLALAQRLSCPALTADRAWLKIADAVGVEVRLIR